MRSKIVLSGLMASVLVLFAGTALADTAKVMAANLARFEH